MYHRYGRHGPHAWKRWRQRKFQQRLPVLAPSVAVVRVHVPIATERIIIIVVTSENYEERDDDNTPIEFPESRLIGTSRDERTLIYQRLENRAKLDAHRKASADITRFLANNEEFPTLQLIELEAIGKALEHINYSEIQKGDVDIAPLRDHSAQTYMKVYLNDIEQAVGKGLIFSEEEKKIRRLARTEKAQHKRELDGRVLSDVELTAHASIRAQEYLGVDTQSIGYLTHILKYVQTYKHAYQEEDDRSPRSAPFQSGGWQAPGSRYTQP